MGPRILIIDDDLSFRRVLQLRLKAIFAELEPISCDTLGQARNLLQKEEKLSFDLVILDEHLPDGSGSAFLKEGILENFAVLSISSDPAPGIPGASVGAGAQYFLGKGQITEPLFQPLIRGLIEQNKLRRQLHEASMKSVESNTVRTLVATLRHEINNPLGAVLGAAYLIRSGHSNEVNSAEIAELVESSGNRIKHVLDKLCETLEVEQVLKADHEVFLIPGDKPWEND